VHAAGGLRQRDRGDFGFTAARNQTKRARAARSEYIRRVSLSPIYNPAVNRRTALANVVVQLFEERAAALVEVILDAHFDPVRDAQVVG